MNLEFLRKSKGFTEEEVSKITGINRSVLSLLEHGHRTPTRSHMLALHRLFGPELSFDLEDEFKVAGVPDMPTPLWTAKGKPDYSSLDPDEEQEEEDSEEGDQDEDLILNDEEDLVDNTKVIYKLQDALRVKFPNKGCIVVKHDDESFIFVDAVGGLYSLGFTQSGNDVVLSNDPPVPVVSMKRTLNQAIRRAKVREGQHVPEPLK